MIMSKYHIVMLISPCVGRNIHDGSWRLPNSRGHNHPYRKTINKNHYLLVKVNPISLWSTLNNSNIKWLFSSILFWSIANSQKRLDQLLRLSSEIQKDRYLIVVIYIDMTCYNISPLVKSLSKIALWETKPNL